MLNEESFNRTVVNGEVFPEKVNWNKKTQQIESFIGFGLCGLHNPAVDVIYIMMCAPAKVRPIVEKTFLEEYHARLMTFERVPASYSHESLMKDMKTHGLTKAISLILAADYICD